MSSRESGGQQHTDANPEPERKPKHRYKLFKKDLPLVEAIFAAWAVLLGFPAKFAWERHPPVSWALVAAIGVLLFVGVFLEAWHRRLGKQLIAWQVVVPAAALHLGALATAAGLYVWGPQPAPPFRVESLSTLVTTEPPSPGRMTNFIVRSPGVPRPVLRPVQRIQYLLAINNSHEKRMILRYRLAVEDGEGWFGPKWTDLCRIEISGRELFEVADTSQRLMARQIYADNAFDLAIAGRVLAPGDKVSGWTLWTCPPDKDVTCSVGKKRMRVTIYDSEGEKSEYFVGPDSKVEMEHSLLHFSDIMDLSGAAWAPYKRCD